MESTAPETISQLLNVRGLSIKKVIKDFSAVVAFSTVFGEGSTPKDVEKTPSVLQSIYDHMSNICRMTAFLRQCLGLPLLAHQSLPLSRHNRTAFSFGATLRSGWVVWE